MAQLALWFWRAPSWSRCCRHTILLCFMRTVGPFELLHHSVFGCPFLAARWADRRSMCASAATAAACRTLQCLGLKLHCHCAQAEKLLDMGIHPLRVAEGYEMACKVAIARLEAIADSFEFSTDNLEPLIRTCMTTLSSKMWVVFTLQKAATLLVAVCHDL